jgi:class 3 adenylate cyclase/tetratricopeptide (TPR) repeat protein
MKCPRCQQENRPGAKFCEECAAPLTRACVNCGAQLSATAKFCSECAHPAGPAAPPGPQRFGAPESYTPKHLAERILTSKAALEGERKQVTVLFADLKGSMELLADRDPEEARRILDPVLELMMEAVHRYGGTVNQVMGDGIMALFGAPIAHEDHAIRACYAALLMQQAVERYSEDARRVYGVNVRIRVGLNSGEVVVRAIGSDLHMDYTAVGHTTHLAARTEQLATPGSILMTRSTLDLVEDCVSVKPLGPAPVKGLAEAVELYEVTQAGPARTRLEASARRGLTRFVGRAAELDTLRRSRELARGGDGQMVALVGEPGVGKSRLVREFIHSHGMSEWLVLRSGGVSYGKSTPYLPVADLFRVYFGVHDGDDDRQICAKVTGKLVALDRALALTLPVFLDLFDVPVDDREWQTLDPPQRRRRTLDAAKALLLRETQVQPLLVVLEDLHWVDYETQALLDSLVDSVPTARIMLLVNYRPEYEPHWGGKTYCGQLRLDPLPRQGAEELLQELLGNDLSLIPVARLLIDRTEGNPFFLEESVRSLAETGILAGPRGAYKLVKRLAEIRVPATVQAVLAARIDRVLPEDKELLQTASVIGKNVPFTLLHAIADESEADLHRQLAHLQAADFLYETALFPTPEYTFKHALTHEVAYGNVLHERRRLLHSRVVEAIEHIYRERLSEHVERLAHHAFHGEMWGKAINYARQAGTSANARSANHEAAGFLKQALAALKRLPGYPRTKEVEVDLRLELRSALQALGVLDLDNLLTADSLAADLGDQRRIGRVSAYLTEHFRLIGDQARALETGHRAAAIADSLGDLSLIVPAHTLLGLVFNSQGHYRAAADVFREVVNRLVGDLSGERFGLMTLPAVHCRTVLVFSLAELGAFGEGIEYGEEAVRIAESVCHPPSIPVAWAGLGVLYVRQGNFDRAVPILERCLALFRALGLHLWLPTVASALGLGYALSGRAVEAVQLLESAIARARDLGHMSGRSLAVASLAQTHLIAHRADRARMLAAEALKLARDHGEQGHEALALRVCGDVSLHLQPLDKDRATAHWREALALAEELGMRPLAAHCHLGLGRLYRRTDKREQAHEHLATATTMYREMGMTYWLEKAEAELGTL